MKASHVFSIGADSNLTLTQTWNNFASQLRAVAAEQEQIDAMEAAFFLGAAQVFTCVDKSARIGSVALVQTMRAMCQEIDTKIMAHTTDALDDVKGNA